MMLDWGYITGAKRIKKLVFGCLFDGMEIGLFVFSSFFPSQVVYGPGVKPIPQVFYVLIHRRICEKSGVGGDA